ncbi:hypothetical protein V6N13_110936 [Hibiscus sabdariffa]|uniref:Uncharacterized protein n=1 Tax=Hibiscus sabdariffa TaxID=183260 RepID=A0ABR2TIQ4_9ROSI
METEWRRGDEAGVFLRNWHERDGREPSDDGLSSLGLSSKQWRAAAKSMATRDLKEKKGNSPFLYCREKEKNELGVCDPFTSQTRAIQVNRGGPVRSLSNRSVKVSPPCQVCNQLDLQGPPVFSPPYQLCSQLNPQGPPPFSPLCDKPIEEGSSCHQLWLLKSWALVVR